MSCCASPTVYQQTGLDQGEDQTPPISSTDASTVRVQVGDDDPHRTLAIDPTISYSTFSAGLLPEVALSRLTWRETRTWPGRAVASTISL